MLTRKETVAVVHCCSNHPQQCGKEHGNRSSTSTVDSTAEDGTLAAGRCAGE
eukprot:EC792312.1.p4 GENE.EC792312.1~~EC792312.1.p4  ORF type:complete len:52 (-),score=15.22 EC792312.1:77-232(-)